MSTSIVNDLYFLIGVVMGFRDTCKQSILHNDTCYCYLLVFSINSFSNYNSMQVLLFPYTSRYTIVKNQLNMTVFYDI